MSESNRRDIHGVTVHGVDIDAQTRCAHWHSPLDVIAIKFACCHEFYSCHDCHAALAGHKAKRWTAELIQDVVLCGACGKLLSTCEYLNSGAQCTECGARFNPACEKHYHLYFE